MLPPAEGGATPVLVLTSCECIADRLRVLHAGHQVFVPTPIEPDAVRVACAASGRR